jgi:uncharacterized protein YeaO (DUF488 family)
MASRGRLDGWAKRDAGASQLAISLRRAYDPPSSEDGPRVLVDRLWPRGVSRAQLKIVAWMRELGPSDELRTWFHHGPGQWDVFERRYRAELAAKGALLRELATYARGGRLTLVYGARDPEYNQAAVIRDVLTRRRPARRPARTGRRP